MTGMFRDVTEAELAVLRVLWDRGQATIREISGVVYGASTESSIATVKKLLSRLEKKALVQRNREQVPHLFEAAIGRDDLLNRRLQGLADELCNGSQTPLLMSLIHAENATDQQREQLRNLVEEISQQDTKKKPAKRRKRR